MSRIGIAGNPNAGKTSIFNQLTGAMQHVSNYPGVTVERKEGTLRLGDWSATVIDLPGTYSLTAYSQEEVVARNFLIEEKPEVVVDVVDASNLERNLYLAVQLMEMRVPLIIALNMTDMAKKKGISIDEAKLSRLLGVPVVSTVGNKGSGVEELTRACKKMMESDTAQLPAEVVYGHEIEEEVDRLATVIESVPALKGHYSARWLAVKLMEGDTEVIKRLKSLCGIEYKAIQVVADDAIRNIEKHFDDDAVTLIAERRYGYAAGAIKECVTLTGAARQDMTAQIDAIVCNRAVGPAILIAVVAALFFFVFNLSDEWAWIPWFGGFLSPTGLMEWCFEGLSGLIAGLEASAPLLHSLLNDGVIGGVGGVMGFVPLIFFMFLFVSALEDSGYIARVAFLLDRLLRVFGLQGKSILSMVVAGGLGAGGCAVPGVMATRTLRENKDRLITMLVVPFMNCGAKMPVYAMLIAAFFTESRTQVMLLLWAISWVVALCAAWVLRKFVIHGEQTPFVMELPPYHVPILSGVLLHTWERTWMYIKKAGTIILAINILLWGMMYFPRLPEDQAVSPDGTELSGHELASKELAHSFAGRIGTTLEPISRAAGFDWRTNIALVGGFAAKEIVVGVLGTAYSMGEVDAAESGSLSERLASEPGWNALKGFTLMIFVMIYAPCFITITVIRRESGSWKWAFFSTFFSTGIAYVLAVLIFQIGNAMGWGVS